MLVVADPFQTTTFLIFRNVFFLLLAALWLAAAFWVWRDARERFRARFSATLAMALPIGAPFVGVLFYCLIRPPERRAEARERELALRELEAALAAPQTTCPRCATAVGRDFFVCPFCALRLKHPCAECGAPLEPSWFGCPYCETAADAALRAAAS